MLGSINKRYLTHQIFEDTQGVTDVYTERDFDWNQRTAVFYVRGNAAMDNVAMLLYKLSAVWGAQNITLRATKEFDALVLSEKALIYSNGRWLL